MTGREQDVRPPDPDWEATVASYMRDRGTVAVPGDVLSAAHARVVRPRAPWRVARLGVAVAATLAVLLLAVLMTTLPGRTPRPTPIPQQILAPARELVLATYHETANDSQILLRPADPVTILPLDGIEPIAVAQPFQAVLSPDGRTLALFSSSNTMEKGALVGSGSLRLIDLDAWTVSDTPVTDLQVVRGMSWTPDSRSLVWLEPRTVTSDGDALGGFRVVRWTIGSERRIVVVALPDPGLSPRDAGVLASDPDSRDAVLAVIGRTDDDARKDAVETHILSIDLDEPRVTGDVTLEGATAPAPDSFPAVAWDLPRQRLLVAGRGDLWTVTLPGLAVSHEVIAQPHAASGTEPSDGAVRVLTALSPDGSRLYLTGFAQSSPSDGSGIATLRPLGLRMVDTDDGSLMEVPDPTVSQVALSPDGSKLLVAGADPVDGTPTEVRLLEAETLEVRSHIPAPAGAAGPYPAEMRISWDGRYGYLGSYIRGEESSHSELQGIDLADRSVLAQRTFDEGEPILTLLVLGGTGSTLP